MGKYSVVLSIILGAIIFMYEFIRKRKSKSIDILSVVNLVFMICFVIVPIYIYMFNPKVSSWAQLVNIEDYYSLKAMLYVIVGYLTLLISINFSRKWEIITRLPTRFHSNPKKVSSYGHFLGILGTISLLVFSISIGGVKNLFTTNTLYRTGKVEVSSFAFIRNLSLFIPISAHIFYGLYKFYTKKRFHRHYIFFLLYTFLSLLVYFNRASRMGLLSFIIAFFLMNAIYYRKRIFRYIPVISLLFVIFIYYGKRIYNFFIVEDFTLKIDNLTLNKIMSEFSFPFYTLTNAMENSFFEGYPRLFFDFILGFINLIPSAILPFDVPMNETQLNTQAFLNISGIPVDIISLGYYSLGINGIIILTFLLGFLITSIEKILITKNNILTLVFYVHFIFFFALLIPYSGPTNLFKSNFALLFAFLIYLHYFTDGKRREN